MSEPQKAPYVNAAKRRNDWLKNAENSLNAVRREVGLTNYEAAALAASDAATALAKAAANHAEVLLIEKAEGLPDDAR